MDVPYGAVPVPVNSQGRPLADWWQRAVAIIIDMVILGIVFRILAAIFDSGNTTTVNPNGSVTVHAGHLIVAELIEIVLTLAYFVILDGGAKGQTIGKLALGTPTPRVVVNGARL